MVLKARFLLCLIALALWTACSDEATSKYSNRAPVRARFHVLEYAELTQAIGNIGEYATIRRQVENGVTKIHMTCSTGAAFYNFTAESKGFEFGLGGLIVGTTINSAGEMEYVCYDLACPVCDRAGRRLTVDEGLAKCANCGASFYLKDEGSLYQKPTNATTASYRTRLYQYGITYNGEDIHVFN